MENNKPIVNTVNWRKAILINTYSIDYIMDMVGEILNKNNILASDIRYRYNHTNPISKLFSMNLDWYKVSIRRAAIYYFVWIKCVISNTEATHFALLQNTKDKSLHLELCYGDDYTNLFTIDHKIPTALWWKPLIWNLQPMLYSFNHKKWSDCSDYYNEDIQNVIKDNISTKKTIKPVTLIKNVLSIANVSHKWWNFKYQLNDIDNSVAESEISLVWSVITAFISIFKKDAIKSFPKSYNKWYIVLRKISKDIIDWKVYYRILLLNPELKYEDKIQFMYDAIDYLYKHNFKATSALMRDESVRQSFKSIPKIEVISEDVFDFIFW